MADIVRRYKVRFPFLEWSVWLVDERTGTLIVFGDRETWSHTWGHSGRREGPGKTDFRFELLTYGVEYIANKLSIGVAKEFDGEATAKRCREEILRLRRRQELTPHTAREWWEITEGADGSDDSWFHELIEEGDVDVIFSDFASYRTIGGQHIDALMSKHWPQVLAAMRREIIGARAVAWFRKDVSRG